MKKLMILLSAMTLSVTMFAQKAELYAMHEYGNCGKENTPSAAHICEWCNIKYNSKGYLVDKQYKIEAVGDFMDTKRTSIYAKGYHWFCSRKCASEYLLSLD